MVNAADQGGCQKIPKLNAAASAGQGSYRRTRTAIIVATRISAGQNLYGDFLDDHYSCSWSRPLYIERLPGLTLQLQPLKAVILYLIPGRGVSISNTAAETGQGRFRDIS